MQIYAHRGANLKIPENTIEAFRQGLFDGATALELDVRVTSDDVVVVFHDAYGWRMAKEEKYISRTPWSDVKHWDLSKAEQNEKIASHFVNKNYRIPDLREILEAFPGIFLNIDIKPLSKKAVSLVIDLVREFKAVERVRLVSYSYLVHKFINDLNYEGPRGLNRWEILLVCLLPATFLQNMDLSGRAIQIPKSWLFFNLDNAHFVEKCHKLGLTVDYWTINKRVEAKKLIEIGADGIMSDDPAAVATIQKV